MEKSKQNSEQTNQEPTFSRTLEQSSSDLKIKDIKKESKETLIDSIDSEDSEEILTYDKLRSEIDKGKVGKEELFQWYREELIKKDDVIKRLKQENSILFKTAIKAREELIAFTKSHTKQNESDNKKVAAKKNSA